MVVPYQLNFSQFAEYDSGEPGVNVKASLKLDQEPINFSAKINTGSTNCIFMRELGEQLGLKNRRRFAEMDWHGNEPIFDI